LLAGFDTVLGGWRAWLTNQFDDLVFISGFFVNALLAAGLVLLGERLGLEAGLADSQISIMMIGAVVVFSSRIFTNLAVLRRLLIDRLRARRATQSVEISSVEVSSDAAPALPPSRRPGNAV
jgi:small basic protein